MNSACIEWSRYKTPKGYGRVSFGGQTQRVHRLVYRLYHDLDESEMPPVIRHKCDNPACYNIEHLEGGTHSDNEWDKVERGRHHNANKTHCARGHEFTPENTYLEKNKRRCRTCKREEARARRDRSKGV